MNNTTTGLSPEPGKVESTVVGIVYILTALPFLAAYAVVNTAIWKDKELFNMICYKFILCGNIAASILTFGNGIVYGIFELLGSTLSNALYGRIMIPIFTMSFVELPLVTGLSLFRFIYIMDWLPQKWLYGWRGHLLMLPTLLYATILTIIYIVTGCEGSYIRAVHVPVGPKWNTDVIRAQAIVCYTTCGVCHFVYFVKIRHMRAVISDAARRSTKRNTGYHLPLIMVTTRVTTNIYFWTIQPLIPASAYPGVVAVLMIIVFSAGVHGVLTLIFVRSIRHGVVSALSFLKPKKVQAPSQSREVWQHNL